MSLNIFRLLLFISLDLSSSLGRLTSRNARYKQVLFEFLIDRLWLSDSYLLYDLYNSLLLHISLLIYITFNMSLVLCYFNSIHPNPWLPLLPKPESTAICSNPLGPLIRSFPEYPFTIVFL